MKLTIPRSTRTYSALIFGIILMVKLNLPEALDIKPGLWNKRFAPSSVGFSIPASVAPPDAEREPHPEPSRAVDTHALICAAAKKHRVPAAFVNSIVAAESNFNRDAVSPKGAIGLMQLMPATAEEYGADPNIPEQNVDAGTHYLRTLMDKYGNRRSSLKRVIAAYNAGPGRVDRYHGVPPFRETRAYVIRVLTLLHRYERDRG
jgi:soluble lytic murein transglycosylase-like protein